mgnify:CR=1 FL=1
MADDVDKDVGQAASTPGKPGTPPRAEAKPSTSEELSDSLNKLLAHAKAAGLRPVQELVANYTKLGLGVLDSLLGALDEGEEKKKAAPRKRKKTT